MASLNFGVKANGSTAFVELFGMKTETIRTMNADNESVEIDWEKRNDQDVIASVAGYKKHYVTFGDGAKEFISDYDTVCYIADKLEAYDRDAKEAAANGVKLPPMQIQVTGAIEKEPYVSSKGTKGFKDKFIVGNVKEVVDAKPELTLGMTLYYNKDSFDFNEFKKEKRLTVDAYILQYLRNSKSVVAAVGEMNKRVFMPQQVVFDATQVDFEDAKQKGFVEIMLEELKVPSNKKLYACHWICSYVNGAEEAPFDESQLTAKQKRMIELGANTIDDFKPKGSIWGPRVKEIRLRKPDYRKDTEFENGVIEVDEYNLNEFEETLVKFIEPESLDAAVEKAQKADLDEVPFELDKEEDLFGGMFDD